MGFDGATGGERPTDDRKRRRRPLTQAQRRRLHYGCSREHADHQLVGRRTRCDRPNGAKNGV
ncbi:hypothetical protein BJI47_03445 [Rhodococcus sp. 1168]|nr:hypothetical protein BJI47_03445 [Rhodococcus sp. 1168]